jgi:type I restriction enzyme S subunit
LLGKDVIKIKIHLPPLEVQKEIVEQIEVKQNAINHAKEIIKNLERERRYFGDELRNLEGVEWVELGTICEIGSSKRVFQSEWKKEGVPFYRAREIVKLAEQGFVDNELFISEEMFDEYSKKYGAPKKGDLMITGVGTLGVAYLVKKNDKFYFKDGNIIWLKNFRQNTSPEFIKLLFETDLIQKQIKGFSAGVTVGTYTITNAKKTKIPLPSLEIQKQLVREAEKEEEIIAANRRLIKLMKRKIEKVLSDI